MAVLVATADGYHIFTSSGDHRTALEGHRVEALSPGPSGTWVAIVDGHEIWEHGADGEWNALASSDLDLTCLVTARDVVFAGAVGPHVLKLERDGVLAPLPGLDEVPGRDEWHQVGSPLQIRSMSATADGRALLANVHVGGIVRSDDGGASWQPTIDVDADVHEVRAHPTMSEIVMAAAAVGLCVSRDGGRRWEIVDDGLHATYARAVAFDGDDVLVSVSDGPFARRSAIYRGSLPDLRLARVRDGLPEWLEGNIDTRCLGAAAGRLALADGSGTVWATTQRADGRRGDWSLVAEGLSRVDAVVVV
ncbi:MAG: hypothetical protein QOH10_997 [Actinomycetota bacterium]|jgi:hypothetical protein|nr:hypothetical protein [Actinomycetota bacterium]